MAREVYLLLLLLFCGRTISERQPLPQMPSETLDFGYVPHKIYNTNAYYEPGIIGILFHIVHAFLCIVQPNYFPQDLIKKLALQTFGNKPGDYQKAVYYEIGFIISAALGILFVLFLPLIGLCFCLCRCCDNCGGEMHQRQKKNANCRRGCFASLLLVATLISSIGVFFAYVANQHLTSQVRGAKGLMNNNFRDLQMLLNGTPGQIDYLVNQYNTTKKKALSDLNNVGTLLSSRVWEQLGKEVYPALDAALTMAGAIRETKEALENVSGCLEMLQEGTEKLHTSLMDVMEDLIDTLNDSACTATQATSTCNLIRNSLNQLTINANYSKLPGVNPQLAKVNEVLKIDLSNLIQKGYAAFNDTPELIRDQTKNILSDIKSILENVGSNITAFTKKLPIQKILTDFTVYLTQSEAYVEYYFPLVEQYDFYRWLGCLILCCMVILILVFFSLGLLCGTCGYDKNATPTTRGCVSNTGGNFLMADCKENKGIYATLRLENLFNIHTILNVSMYAEDVSLKIKKININLSNIVLLSNTGKENLLNFGSSGINEISYAAYLSEINKSITKIDLLLYANDLEARADQLPKGALENALKGHANTIRLIHNQQVVPLEQGMSTLNQSIRLLQKTSLELPEKVRSVISAIEATQLLINNNASFIIVQEAKKYMDTILGYFEQYSVWVKDSITTQVATCKPIANTIDTAVDIFLCSYVMDSLNAFWFGLGGCCILLIPAIICAVKLAKFYRRMDTEDVYDDLENCNIGYHKEQLYGIHNPVMTSSVEQW
ncbi:prominin-1 [Notechis scutatus]|uniref:Prominin-1 n=1 Tax=Notechis scutatus TaxID=8663 RepID=A0A6J1UW26_9SAUR|nr:prominin-1 [Notechis scutatus]